jgi:signal transduction histidine kinase/CheY-like chemotaxis protein
MKRLPSGKVFRHMTRMAHRSVHRRLMIAMGALVGVSLLAGLVGWVGLYRSETQLVQMQARSLQDLHRVLDLAERSARLTARAPALAQASDPGRFARAADDLHAELQALDAIARTLPAALGAWAMPTDVPSIARLLDRLNSIVAHLMPAVEERLAAAQELRRLRALAAGQTDPEAVALAMQAMASSEPHHVAELRDRFAGRLPALQPVFDLRLREIHAGWRAEVLLAAIDQAAAQLTTMVRDMAQSVQTAALRQGEETAGVLRGGRTALLAGAAVLLLGALVVASTLMRDMASNLARTTRAMQRLAGGDLEAEAPGQDRADEIGDLARAFGIFKVQAADREELTRRLARNTRWMAGIIENLQGGVALFDAEGGLVAWNPRLGELGHLAPAQIASGTDLATLLRLMLATGAEGRALDYAPLDLSAGWPADTAVLELRRPEGTVLEARLSAIPAGGSLLGIADLTDRKIIERQLRQAQKMEAVGQLTGGIAHDFNNLLAAISSNLQLIEETAEPGTPAAARALRALDAVESGSAMVQRLLAFARRQSLAPQSVDLNRLVADLADLLEAGLGHGLRLELDLAADLPAVRVDPGQMEQALLNLVFNARDALGHRGRITIATHRLPPHMARVVVADDGPGMTAEVLSHAFEPFFTTKPFGTGSGLGLSTVYGFVQQSGGQIRLDSAPDVGTRVILDLPLAREAHVPATVAAPVAHPVLQAARILLVEDDPRVLEATAELLERLGMQVTTADAAEPALALLRADGFDLLLTDIVLRHSMSGVELAREARKLRPALPILFCSGYAEATAPEGAPLLRKPFRHEELRQRLQQMLPA